LLYTHEILFTLLKQEISCIADYFSPLQKPIAVLPDIIHAAPTSQDFKKVVVSVMENKILDGKLFNWKISTQIARGGNSVVYLASQNRSTSEENVAIKLFEESSRSGLREQRFLSEIEIVKSLKSIEGCCTLLDHGFYKGRPFYVMPYYKHGNFYDRYIKNKNESEDIVELLENFLKLVQTVVKLHEKTPRLAIRDIKPQNILLNDGQPILCDFGLALWSDTPTEERLTSMELIGSTGYRPPEWSTSYPEPDQTAGDIWSLGRTLWAICARSTPPNNYDSLATAEFHLSKYISDKKTANAVQGVISDATKFDANSRPTSLELSGLLKDVIAFCHQPKTSKTTLENELLELRSRIKGSSILATANQRKLELEAKFQEVKEAQDLMLSKLRTYQQTLSSFVDIQVGTFGVFGKELSQESHNHVASAYITFFPGADLRAHNFPVYKYEFIFGVRTSNDFFWTESFHHSGHEFPSEIINPRSLTVLAAKKSNQIESILREQFIPTLTQLLQ
jgi:serine/threonine protein kinase